MVQKSKVTLCVSEADVQALDRVRYKILEAEGLIRMDTKGRTIKRALEVLEAQLDAAAAEAATKQ
jgi:hypothetical protein